jgi:hypothetical protein
MAARALVPVLTGAATTVGFEPTDESFESTPTPGVAVGLGVEASSSLSASPVVGAAAGTSTPQTARALTAAGAATATAGAPTAVTSALLPVCVAPAIGIVQGSAVATAPGVVTTVGVGATHGARLPLGTVVTASVPSSTLVVVTLPIRLVRAIGGSAEGVELGMPVQPSSHGTLDALERLPAGVAVSGVELVGVVVAGMELVGS